MSLGARELSAVVELGYWLIRTGSLSEAQQLWEGLAAEVGHLEAPWRALAYVSLRQGRVEECVSHATIANQRKPGAPAPLVLRAEALMRAGRFQEAARDLAAALRLPPRSPLDLSVHERARALQRRVGAGAMVESAAHVDG